MKVQIGKLTLTFEKLLIGARKLLCFLPNQKAERRRPFGTGLVRHCPQGLFSPFFTFLRAIFFRPFRLSLAPTICPWVSEDVFPRERQKSSPKVMFLWTLYRRNRKPSITNPWHPGLYSADGLVVLYSLDLSSKYYFKVTEGCPFSLADAQDWQGFLKVTISNKFFLQFSLSYRVLCFFLWAFLEFMKIFKSLFYSSRRHLGIGTAQTPLLRKRWNTNLNAWTQL